MEKLSERIRATKNLPDLELVLAEALYAVDLIGEKSGTFVLDCFARVPCVQNLTMPMVDTGDNNR